jgi:hypothetical protein
VYSAINCLKRENKLKKKGKQKVKVQQSCSYIDVLSVTWLAKREGDSRCWHCASWPVTDITELLILYNNNSRAVTFIYDLKFYTKLKYINICYMFIQNNLVAQNCLKVEYIPSTNQPANILTKQLLVDTIRKYILTLRIQ